jgi:GDP-4-dehydro-6-deoxy-D-mannose reductase
VLVTGSRGFVGRWVGAELERAGHEWLPEADGASGRLEVTDRAAVVARLVETRPDAVIHLAAISSAAEASRDPDRAEVVAVDGTRAVIAGLAASRERTGTRPILLVAGSGEVYGAPTAADLPLTEDSPLRPATVYARTKLAQEATALGDGTAAGLQVIAVRAFNHTGAGQSPTFAVPAFAARILAARAAGASSIVVGDIDVRRDLTDVRDVANAYRRLIELAAAGQVGPNGLVVNVASGRSVLLRDVVAQLAALAGVEVEPVVDPALLRAGQPPEVRGDPARLQALTGWRPAIPLETTLRDVLAGIAAGA